MPAAPILLAIGLFTGFAAGMLGAGGGFGTIVLLLAAGVGPHVAIGTSPIYTTVIGSWGSILHVRRGTADPRLAAALGLPSIATAMLGAQIAESLPGRTLMLTFAALTLAVAIPFLVRPLHPAALESPVSGGQDPALVGAVRFRTPLARRTLVGALAGGAAIGILQGLYGVGGGFLLVPFMVLALGVPERVAVGSSLFALVFGSLASGIRHASLDNVGFAMLWWLIPGGLVGTLLGARLMPRLSPATIRRCFVAMMLSSAVYLIVKTL